MPAEDFDKAIDEAYEKNKDRFKVDGFRKGKVPREMIEKVYGVGVFYDDATTQVLIMLAVWCLEHLSDLPRDVHIKNKQLVGYDSKYIKS